MENNKGESTHPWGAPMLRAFVLYNTPSLTFCTISVRKFVIQLQMEFGTVSWLSLIMNIRDGCTESCSKIHNENACIRPRRVCSSMMCIFHRPICPVCKLKRIQQWAYNNLQACQCQSLKAFHNYWEHFMNCSIVIKAWVASFLGTGKIIDRLKHDGTLLSFNDFLNIWVKWQPTLHNISGKRGGTWSGPEAFLMFF